MGYFYSIQRSNFEIHKIEQKAAHSIARARNFGQLYWSVDSILDKQFIH